MFFTLRRRCHRPRTATLIFISTLQRRGKQPQVQQNQPVQTAGSRLSKGPQLASPACSNQGTRQPWPARRPAARRRLRRRRRENSESGIASCKPTAASQLGSPRTPALLLRRKAVNGTGRRPVARAVAGRGLSPLGTSAAPEPVNPA